MLKISFNLPCVFHHIFSFNVVQYKTLNMEHKILRFTCLLLLVALVQACETKSKNWVFHGEGKISGKLYLYSIDQNLNKTIIDSTFAQKGQFSLEETAPGDRLTPYQITFVNKEEKESFEFLIKNGEKLKAVVKDELNITFSGTPIAERFNTLISFRQEEMNNLMEFKQTLADETLDTAEMDEKMLIFQEKMQDMENKKIAFIKTITDPELNSYLVLREAVNSGAVEKEIFGKYVSALNPESSMTNTGHKVHQIYEVFDAYALNRELELLDTATIRARYERLNEENKNSEFAKEILNYLNKPNTQLISD